MHFLNNALISKFDFYFLFPYSKVTNKSYLENQFLNCRILTQFYDLALLKTQLVYFKCIIFFIDINFFQ